MNYKLGLFKSYFDERDFLYRSFIRLRALPSEFSIESKMTPVRNQSNEGSCAGHNAQGAKEFQEQIDLKKFISLSPRYIYEYAKKISGHSEGTTLKAIVQALLTIGICEEQYWPYKAGDPSGKNPLADANAQKYKIKGYARITTVDELKQAIFNPYPQGGAILAGLRLFKGAVGDDAKSTGITPDPSCWDEWRDGPIGGHAIEPCAWNDNSPYYKNDGHIKFKGSWGEHFGAKGYHYFSYKNIKKNMMDCMALIDIKGSANILTVANLPKKGEELWV